MDVAHFLDVFAVQYADRLHACRLEARGQLADDELAGEVFLLMHELGEERGQALQLRDPLDAERVLNALLRRARQLGRYRRGVSLEDSISTTGDAAAPTLLDLQQGPEDWEPLKALMALEEAPEDAFGRIQASYSLAAAYLVLLERHGWCAAALAQAFRLGAPALRERFAAAYAWLCRQPSLFDGIERVPADFLAWYGWLRPARRVLPSWGEQQCLALPGA